MHGIRNNSALRPTSTLLSIPHDGSKQGEADLVQCCHCNRIHAIGESAAMELIGSIMQGKVELGFCSRCNGVTCPGERCQDCIPQEAQIENLEAGLPARTPRPVKLAFPSGVV